MFTQGVRRGSFDSPGCTLEVDRFISGLWIHTGVPWGRLVQSGSEGSRGCALGVVGFILGRWVHVGTPWMFSGSFEVFEFMWGR